MSSEFVQNILKTAKGYSKKTILRTAKQRNSENEKTFYIYVNIKNTSALLGGLGIPTQLF